MKTRGVATRAQGCGLSWKMDVVQLDTEWSQTQLLGCSLREGLQVGLTPSLPPHQPPSIRPAELGPSNRCLPVYSTEFHSPAVANTDLAP